MCDWWEAVDWAPGGDARATPSGVGESIGKQHRKTSELPHTTP